MFPSLVRLGEGSSNPTPEPSTMLLGSSLSEESAALQRWPSAGMGPALSTSTRTKGFLPALLYCLTAYSQSAITPKLRLARCGFSGQHRLALRIPLKTVCDKTLFV
jgi:hypothetical protein